MSRKVKSKRASKVASRRRVRRGFKASDAVRDSMRATRRFFGFGASA